MSKKTYDKKKDFIMLISSMTDRELDKDGNIIDPNIEKIQ